MVLVREVTVKSVKINSVNYPKSTFRVNVNVFNDMTGFGMAINNNYDSIQVLYQAVLLSCKSLKSS